MKMKDEELLIAKLIENKKTLFNERDRFGFAFSMDEGFRNGTFGYSAIYPKLEEYLKSVESVIREMVEQAVKEENEKITSQIKALSEKL